MATFPRLAGAKPRIATPPRFPTGLQSWGDTGKGQTRALVNMGRTWEEIYGVLDTTNPNVRALLAALNQSLREGTVWSVQHPYWHQMKGAGGGAPVVNGAGQSGNAINLKGANANVSKWLRQGDMMTIAGAPVVFDVAADVDTDANGNATVLISPPIFAGNEPNDLAIVEYHPSQIFFNAIIIDVADFPQMDNSRYLDAGLTLTWREQPT